MSRITPRCSACSSTRRRHRRRQENRPWPAASGKRHDRGSATLELAILAPGLILALLLLIAAGRVATAHAAVEAAARDAARQASIARDPATARTDATSSAQAALVREGLTCPARVNLDTSGFARAVGQPATVTAQVSCTVGLADLSGSGIPATTVTARFTSPIDPFRGRQP